MKYINKSKSVFLSFISMYIVLLSMVLFCVSCFEDIKYKDLEKYKPKGLIEEEELENIRKDIESSSDHKDEHFSDCINEEKDRSGSELDSKTSKNQSINLEKTKVESVPNTEEARLRKEKSEESSRQQRIRDIIFLEQSMQSLGGRLQEAYQERINREASILRRQEEEEQVRIRLEEERVRIQQEMEQLRISREALERRQEEENQDRLRSIAAESIRLLQEAILESIITESDRVSRQQDRNQGSIRRETIRLPIINEENNSNLEAAMEASRITASRHARSLRPEVMSEREVIAKLNANLTRVSGCTNDECPICYDSYEGNSDDCYQLTTCCKQILHINCLATASINSYTETGIYSCPFCRSRLL